MEIQKITWADMESPKRNSILKLLNVESRERDKFEAEHQEQVRKEEEKFAPNPRHEIKFNHGTREDYAMQEELYQDLMGS